MTKLIRNNQKIVLAVVGVVLMIAFVAGYGGSARNGHGGGADREVGRAGGSAVMASEVNAGRAELQAVTTFARQFSRERPDPAGNVVVQLARLLQSRPVDFALLRRQATAAAVTVDSATVQRFLDDHLGGISDDGLPVDPPPVDSDNYALVRAGVTDLYAALQAFDRVTDAFKASRPVVDRTLAEVLQTVTFNLAQVRAEPYAVPAPTTQQVADQFRRYADATPEVATADDPFGFGYRRPVRVRVQYLRLTRSAVEAAVNGAKSDYDWDVQARKVYHADPDRYVPQTQPTTTDGRMPPQPTINSEAGYQAARMRILAELKNPLVKQLQAQVQAYLVATLTADHAAYLAATGGPTASPTASSRPAPPSSVDGQPYDTRGYLRAVAAAAQAKFNVVVDTDQTPPLSLKQLTDMPTLGKAGPDDAAMAAANAPSTGPLPNYVFDRAAAALDGHAATALMAPSPAFVEPPAVPDAYDPSAVAAVDLARVASVTPSTPATDLDAVRLRVEDDCRTAAAYAVAKAKAERLATAAAAAGVIVPPPGTPVLKTQPLTPRDTTVDGLQPPLAAAAPTFMAQAFTLLDGYDPKARPHPTTTISLPDQQRAFAAQLSQVSPRWTAPDDYFRTRLDVAEALRGRSAAAARAAWFDLAAIERRARYTPAVASSESP